MKKKKSFFGIKFIVIIIFIAVTVFLIYHKFNNVDVVVVDGRENWDIFSAGDTAMSGDFSGMIYEKNYTVDTLPNDYATSLVVDYYLATTSNFFVEENQKEDISYHKVLSKEDFNKIVEKMFGPDNNIKTVPVEYGCGRFLRIVDDTYIIGSNDPDACGLFNYRNASHYVSFIDSYQKDQNKVIINLKVAFIAISVGESDEGEEVYYNVYTDKTKTDLITGNYNPSCLYEKNDGDKCYKGFVDYQVTLKKESNNKYYFYSISKQ